MRLSSLGGLAAAAALLLISTACVPNDTSSRPSPAPAQGASTQPASSPGTAGNTATGPGTPEARPPIASPAASPAAQPGASPAAKPSASPAVLPTPAAAPSPAASGTFGFGRTPSQAEIRRVDIDVRADGVGLPPGGGTAAEGRAVYAAKCASCHGANGEGTTIAPKLVDPTPFRAGAVTATIGNYWPYAPTAFDYIRRAMPFNAPGSLTDQEVYQVTAFLLQANQLIGENDRMDAQSLPRVQMPNRASFTSPDPRPDTGTGR